MSGSQAKSPFISWNRLLYAHYALGVLAGLLLPAGLADSAIGRTLLALFPALGALSANSADPAVWGSYCVLMLLLTGLLLPVVAILLFRDADPPGDSKALMWSLLLALIFAAFIWFMLFGSAGLWSHQSFDGRTRGDVLGRFLLDYRAGLALVGSLFMSLLLFFAALLAVLPLAPLKARRRRG